MASTLVAAPLAVAKAFSPGHITGFFEIPKSNGTDPLTKGSRGAGFSIEKGISTTVQIFESKIRRSQILINGRTARPIDVEVSQWVIDNYIERYASNKESRSSFFVKVEHQVDIAVGYGIGSSGAAALSLCYALDEAFGSTTTGQRRMQREPAQLAHEAEIACKTGLGTVIAEYAGGFEMRLSAGAPGVGKVERIPLEDTHSKVAILCISPISTKQFLATRLHKITGLGDQMLARLAKSRSINDFLKMSYDFADTLGLTDGICRPPIRALKAAGFECSVALFGETVFTVVPNKEIRKVSAILQRFGGQLIVCDIDTKGARVLY